MLSLILKSILERAAIPEHQRKPVLIFIDEAGSVFSRDISSMLEEVRKYNAGVILAHQNMSQCTPSLAASIHSNTSTKLCAGGSASDAVAMAKEMRCDSDFIMNQPRLSFATYIRHVTPSAVSIHMPFVTGYPTLSYQEHEELLERNRARVSIPPQVAYAVPRVEEPESPSPAPRPLHG